MEKMQKKEEVSAKVKPSDKLRSHWNERWRKVVGEYPSKQSEYYISDYGRIKAIDKRTGKEKELKGSRGSGYKMLNIRLEEGKRLSMAVHKFVAEHFLEKTEEDVALNREFLTHIDGNKENNHYKNLKRLSRLELTELHKERGIISDKVNREKLVVKMTATKVLLLKKRLKAGKTKRKILAKQFDITMTQLRRIEKGENWADVKLKDDTEG